MAVESVQNETTATQRRSLIRRIEIAGVVGFITYFAIAYMLFHEHLHH